MKTFNISGQLAQALLPVGSNINISKISLTNIQNVSKCKVDLYIEKSLSGKFYILKSVELPIGATLIHDFTFNNNTNEYGLYLKLTKSASEIPSVDVIIK